jgi:hypothetical protein
VCPSTVFAQYTRGERQRTSPDVLWRSRFMFNANPLSPFLPEGLFGKTQK